MYLYIRNSLKRDDPITNVPYLITKYKSQQSSGCEWRKLRFNKQNNTWADADITTDMMLRPGDILNYDHQATKSITLTAERFQITTQEIPVIPEFKKFSITSNFGDSIQFPVTSTNVPINVLSSFEIPNYLDILPGDPNFKHLDYFHSKSCTVTEKVANQGYCWFLLLHFH